MKRKFFFVISAIAILLIFSSCGEFGVYSLLFGEEDAEARYSSFSDKSCAALSAESLSAKGLTKYCGIVITDPHFGSSKTRHEDEFYDWLRNTYNTAEEPLKPRFLVCLGDTADSGKKGQYEDFNNFAAKVKEIAKEKLSLKSTDDFPVYTILGNHDLYNNGWSDWKDLIYPYTSSYYFDVGKFRFFGTDTGSGSLGNDQLKDFEKLLKADSSSKIVLSHYPIYAGGIMVFAIHDTYERNRILTACAKGNVKQILTGHQHEPIDFTDYEIFQEHVIGSFVYKRVFALLTMDEKDGSVTYKRIDY